jgi:citrate lyase subunit beta/citryl-CoA lyase
MRSLLFVPGDSERKLARAVESGADALLLDLEDSVASDAKPRARKIVAEYLVGTRRLARRPKLYVRVNPFDGDLTEADLDAVMPAAPDGIMLPKCANGADVQRLGAKLVVREAEFELPDGATRILAIATESARAVFGLASYAGCSARLEGLAWGAEDLSADVGSSSYRTADGGYTGPYRLARDLLLFAAVAADVAPIDTVHVNFRDEAGLRAECLAACRDGFVAKMAIHPAQVAIINEAFTPTGEAIARARAIIAAFEAAPGAGVLSVDGQMFDLPHLKRSRKLLARVGGGARPG